MPRTTGATAGSVPNVRRAHSSAMRSARRPGSQARRPNAYRFASARSWPSQLGASPTFDTPTKPPSGRPKVRPVTSWATGVPLRPACMSKSSTSCHIGARKTTCRCCPVYSCVICSSMAWFVRRSAANSGDAGSRTWKSIGPCFTCRTTLSSNCPSSAMKLSNAALARSFRGSRQSMWWSYTNPR